MGYGLNMQTSLWPSEATVLDGNEYQHLAARIRPAFVALMKQQRLHHDLMEPLCRIYLPLAAWLSRQKPAERALVFGINGAQGSGKSTMCAFLKLILRDCFGYRVAGLSLDDLYHTHDERERLAREVHPLLATRGVPGTHDVHLGAAIIDALTSEPAGTVAIPAFDKALDDRKPVIDWPVVTAPVDFVLFEGWCVGTQPQPDRSLKQPLNELEQRDDEDGGWRRYVNQQLAGDYARLFAKIDLLGMLKVPNMACVYEWRSLQEEKLATAMAAKGQHHVMDSSGLKRFIMHYERLTLHNLEEMPDRADIVLYLNEHHQFTSIHLNP